MMMHAFKYSLCIEAIQRHRPNFPSESYFSEWPKKKNKFDQIRNTCTINLAPVVCSYIHRVSKKGTTKLMAVTSSNLNRFSKLFHH